MKETIMESLEQTGFAEEIAAVRAGKCPFCGKVVDKSEFRDEAARKEFEISGLCQKCQDKFFNEK